MLPDTDHLCETGKKVHVWFMKTHFNMNDLYWDEEQRCIRQIGDEEDN